jgi:hypothetical protein
MQLKRGLKSRHVELIAIGGAIGVGLFLGSAKAIQNGGPGLILGYAFGGLVIFFAVRTASPSGCRALPWQTGSWWVSSSSLRPCFRSSPERAWHFMSRQYGSGSSASLTSE